MKIRLESSLGERIFRRCISAMALLLILLFLLQLADTDYSKQQNERLRRVGIIYEDLTDPYWAAVANELRKNASAAGIMFIMRDATSAGEKRQKNIETELAEKNLSVLAIAKKAATQHNETATVEEISNNGRVIYLNKPTDTKKVSPEQFAADTLAALGNIHK